LTARGSRPRIQRKPTTSSLERDPLAASWPPILLATGKVLGECSSINGLVYIRGQSQDFDYWRQLGNTGWSFTGVLPYFKRAEDRIGDGGGEMHDTGGPLAVSDVNDDDPISEAFISGRSRIPTQSRLQRAHAGRRRLLPSHHTPGSSVLDRRRLPAADDEATQPSGHHACLLRTDFAGRQTCHRGGVAQAIVSGNPNAATIMIAEKAADLVRGVPAQKAEVEAASRPRMVA
jgi:choline dehydrogenase-like flavoprotein